MSEHVCVTPVERDGHKFECCHSWCLPWCRKCGRNSDYDKPCDGNLLAKYTEEWNEARYRRDRAQALLDTAGARLNKERAVVEARPTPASPEEPHGQT